MRSLAVVFLIAACTSGPDVGHTCSSTAPDCDESLTCSTAVLGGYCTAVCTTPGSTSQCPDGSVCDDTPALGLSCLKLCDTTTDCGRTGVMCNGVTSSNLKACRPD
jgi:hypothetical protein